MDKRFNSSEKIGAIAARFPKSMEIFKEYGIDFCCGGDAALIVEIKEHGINEEELMNRLEKAYEDFRAEAGEEEDWNVAAYSKLIDHIVYTHHAYLTKMLPKISELTAKILRVHGANHEELSKVYRLFHSLKMELDQHLIKEEEILFPLIKKFEETQSTDLLEKSLKTIAELEAEHEGAGDILKELRRVTKNYAIPEDSCNTYMLTYNLLEEMEGDLFKHIHLENNILFPRLQKDR